MPLKPIHIPLLVFIILGCLIVNQAAAENESPGQNSAISPDSIKQVFLISIDGLNYEGFISSYAPNMNFLASEGVVDRKSMSFIVNTIEASEACLITGTFPEEHKFINASDSLEVESLLDQIRKTKRQVLLVDASGGKLERLGADNYIKIDAQKNDREAFQAAIKQHGKEHPFFNYIYVNDCLDALLSLNQKTYSQTITKVDQYLGELLDYLREQGEMNNTLIVITSPRSSSTSNLCPLIMHGPGCKPGTVMTDTMLIDVAPTLSYMLGLKVPFNVRGIPLYEAMSIEPRQQLPILNTWIKSLKKERIATWKRYFDSQEELYRTIKQLIAVQEERQNIFQYAGQREDTILSLQNKIRLQRIIGGVIILLMAAGYLVEYRWLRRKFLLFH